MITASALFVVFLEEELEQNIKKMGRTIYNLEIVRKSILGNTRIYCPLCGEDIEIPEGFDLYLANRKRYLSLLKKCKEYLGFERFKSFWRIEVER